MKANKKFFGTALALALACGVGIGATLAYLNHVTEDKVNTFTSSKDIQTEITETEFHDDIASNYYPGQVITKNPGMVNNSDTESIWVAVKLDYVDNDKKKVSAAEFEKYASIVYGSEGNYQNGVNPAWIKIASNNTSDVYMFSQQVAPHTTTNPTVFDAVKVNTGIKEVIKTEYETTTIYDKDKNPIDVKNEKVNTSVDYYITNEQGDLVKTDVFTLPKFEVVVKGFAMQATGVDEATAKTELVNLVNAHLADGENSYTAK